MTKYQLAVEIENHNLYEPQAEGIYSKKYYRYNSEYEIKILCQKRKKELQDMYDMLYDSNGRELAKHEIAQFN